MHQNNECSTLSSSSWSMDSPHGPRSHADIVKLYRSFLHHSSMLSIHSLILGLPHLPFPSMIPNITLFIFLLSSILHNASKQTQFPFHYCLHQICFNIWPFQTFFVTFIVQFKCNILQQQYITKAKILSLSVFLIVHVSQAYRAVLNTHVFKTFNLVL